MSFIGRWWRWLDAEYDVADSWPVTFTVVFLSLLLSIPSLLYYTYRNDDENAALDNYWSFPYSSHWYPLSSESLREFELWRLLSSQLVFSSAAEIVLGTVLLLFVRHAESRVAYSQRRVVFVLVAVLLVCVGCECGVALRSLSLQSGPYWLAFFLLPLYATLVPAVSSLKLCGLTFSDKWLAYVLALQLALFLPPPSLLSTCFPLALGILYALYVYCAEGGLQAVLHPSRPQGMRVGRRGEVTGYKRAGPAGAAGLAAVPSAAPSATEQRAARPSSHYEKLLANAKAGERKATSPRRDAAAAGDGDSAGAVAALAAGGDARSIAVSPVSTTPGSETSPLLGRREDSSSLV